MGTIKFYTSHCSKCKILSKLMNDKNIAYEVIDNEDIYLQIADDNGIMAMPFAEVNGEIYDSKKLEKYIMTYVEG